MNENISRLMDGEVDGNEVDAVCAALKRQDAIEIWMCYHVIGDAMRGAGAPRMIRTRAWYARGRRDEPPRWMARAAGAAARLDGH